MVRIDVLLDQILSGPHWFSSHFIVNKLLLCSLRVSTCTSSCPIMWYAFWPSGDISINISRSHHSSCSLWFLSFTEILVRSPHAVPSSFMFVILIKKGGGGRFFSQLIHAASSDSHRTCYKRYSTQKKPTQNQKTQTRKEKHLTTAHSKEYEEMQSSTRLVSGTVI